MSETTIHHEYSLPEETTRVALLVEYCGKAYHGNQFQPGLSTVQQALQTALASLNLKTSAVSFAGRTDAGVHAQGQVAHVDIETDKLANITNLRDALNAVLPEDIAVRSAFIGTSRQFNSRRDATAKWYQYRILNAPARSVWAGPNTTLVRKPLDVVSMNQAAQLLVGTHNFKSFKCADSAVTNDLCTVYHCQVHQDGTYVTFDIVANRFVYKMVRNITGQLLAIGGGQFTPESILEVLAAQDRSQAHDIAKPEGLSLMAVLYPEPYNFFAGDTLVQQATTLIKPMESENENLFRKAS